MTGRSGGDESINQGVCDHDYDNSDDHPNYNVFGFFGLFVIAHRGDIQKAGIDQEDHRDERQEAEKKIGPFEDCRAEVGCAIYASNDDTGVSIRIRGDETLTPTAARLFRDSATRAEAKSVGRDVETDSTQDSVEYAAEIYIKIRHEILTCHPAKNRRADNEYAEHDADCDFLNEKYFFGFHVIF